MAKTNYTKVEEIMEQGLRKMSINQVFDDSGKAEKKPRQTPLADQEEKTKDVDNQLNRAQIRLISALKRDLKYLHYRDHTDFYASLGMKKSTLKKKIETPSALKGEEWEAIKKIKQKIDLYRAELSKQIPEVELSQEVDEERIKHVNKRFNVNNKWLPLH